MTAIGWLQILFFFGAIVLCDQAARRLHVPRLRGRAPLPAARRSAGWSASSTGCAASTGEGADLERSTPARCSFQRCSALLVTYAIQRLQHVLPFNPQGFGAVEAGARLQHGRQLHDQHQLAGLRRRVDDELPHARWRGSPGTTSPRRRPASASRSPSRAASRARARRDGGEHARQLLGRPDPRHRLRAAADLRRRSRSSSSRRA